MRSIALVVLAACSTAEPVNDRARLPAVAALDDLDPIEPVHIGRHHVNVQLTTSAEACKRDLAACQRLDEAEGGVEVDTPYPWNAVVGRMTGHDPATLGRVFAGLVFGAAMPDATKRRIVAFESHYLANVHYDMGDGAHTPSLEVTFQYVDSTALRDRWGKPDAQDRWISPDGTMVATLRYDPFGVVWRPTTR